MNTNSPITGAIKDPKEFFEREKADIVARLGDTSGVRIILNRIWVAVWVRPDHKDLGEGRKLFYTENARNEDVYQGNAGLVVKMGPLAYQSDDQTDFGGETCKVGDWVLYTRQSAGMRFKYHGVDCFMMETEKAIKAVLDRPDMVE